MIRVRFAPEVPDELAEAALWYEARKQVREDEVRVLAVAHAKRRPGYWLSRVRP